ncbi:hypothetical protein L195_g058698 [Trifolium pratense]|uniref:Uncharacterized protein n=1 Tax=Trifolium pratense TaxID=57577 RepID=A0A2K3JTS7_TRIPR|nr:hypothetical protein L195_g058698 [Trifolium pratense]
MLATMQCRSHEVGVAIKRWPLLLKKEAYSLLLELGLKKAIGKLLGHGQAGPSQHPSIPYVKGVEWGFLTPVWADPTLSPTSFVDRFAISHIHSLMQENSAPFQVYVGAKTY